MNKFETLVESVLSEGDGFDALGRVSDLKVGERKFYDITDLIQSINHKEEQRSEGNPNYSVPKELRKFTDKEGNLDFPSFGKIVKQFGSEKAVVDFYKKEYLKPHKFFGYVDK